MNWGDIMGDIVYKASLHLFGNFLLAVVFIPMGLIFLGYLIYIIVMVIKEMKK